MNKDLDDELRIIETPQMIAHVSYKGDWLPMQNVTFLNIEEDMQGKDVVTFEHQNATHKSYVTFRPARD